MLLFPAHNEQLNLIKSLRSAHCALDVERFYILPVFLQQRNLRKQCKLKQIYFYHLTTAMSQALSAHFGRMSHHNETPWLPTTNTCRVSFPWTRHRKSSRTQKPSITDKVLSPVPTELRSRRTSFFINQSSREKQLWCGAKAPLRWQRGG